LTETVRLSRSRNGRASKISCSEEIAWRNGWIGAEDVERIGRSIDNNAYGQYLTDLVRRREEALV